MKIIRKIMLALTIMSLLATTSQAAALSSGSSAPLAKDISVTPRDGALKAVLKPIKDAFGVNEDIQLFAQVNKQAYVYLFSINRDGSGVLLFPNEIDKDNRLAANKQVLIPSKAAFKSDTVGSETVYMVASTIPLKLSQKKITKGEFTSFEKDSFDGMFKDIRVEPRQGAKEERIVIDRDIPIIGSAQQASQTQQTANQDVAQQAKPVVLVGTDKLSYKNGDTVTVSFASDTDGVVELLTINPKNEVEPMGGDRKVEKGKVYTFRTQAIPPTGKQYVVAVYKSKGESKAGEAKPLETKSFAKSLVIPAKPSLSKDLRIIEEKPTEPEAFAAYQFEIR